MAQENQNSDHKSNSLRISIDCKAKVKIGNLSRGGKSRCLKPLEADDHDHQWTHVLVPFGIMDMTSDNLWVYFGKSAQTSDFVIDCIQKWWSSNQKRYEQIEELVIDLDGGSATRSNRSQFIKRMVEFAKENKLRVRLIYYPPYHSKYNPIERCWAVLENHWNGAILDSIEKAMLWASTMTWKGISPIVDLVTNSYEKGVKVLAEELEELKKCWKPSKKLAKWDVTVTPF